MMMMMGMPKHTWARIHPRIPVSVSGDRPARVDLVKIATNDTHDDDDDDDDEIMGGVIQGVQYQDNWDNLLKRKKAAFQLEVCLSKRIKKVTTVAGVRNLC